MANTKKLRVWWNPAFNDKSFYIDVSGLVEAKKVLNVLADYDNHLVEFNILSDDHCNCGGLEEFDEDDKTEDPNGSWVEWESSNGDDIADISYTEAGRIDRFSRS
jgi:hypothetical protein